MAIKGHVTLFTYSLTRNRIYFWESLFYSSFVAIGFNAQNMDQLLSSRAPQAFNESVRWHPDLKLHAGAIQPGTRILYFWILPERALSFPLNKGNEGSEKLIESEKVVWNL